MANAAPELPLPPTVGALLTRASAAVTNRDCSSPRSLLSRILHRRRAGFGCRLRLPLPRYCSSGAAKDAIAAKEEATAPKVVGSRAEPPRESPRSSLAEKKKTLGAEEAASLVLLLSKSAAELSRMAELRAQMERIVMDIRAGHTDSVKEPVVFDGECGAVASCGGSENAGHWETMGQMEAELEVELSRLQVDSNVTPGRDHLLEAEAKSGATSGSHSVICSDSNVDDDQDDDEEEDEESPGHGGVPARELERRLHELLQSRHEARIAELESALERARRKLKEKEREACRWRDTAKLAARFTDESRLR